MNDGAQARSRRRETRMEQLLLAAAALACPVGMGAMMFMMMRRSHGADMAEGEEMTRLRAEVDQLKSERQHHI